MMRAIVDECFQVCPNPTSVAFGSSERARSAVVPLKGRATAACHRVVRTIHSVGRANLAE